ncbi:protein FAM107B [Melanotaenia boesemani]|uniref:protein FAM107B n=1 Tax=Melanotaenia boesemani TaxID=1250792 RepID=UPI001C040FAD|nr:protein FAM107B [Melanotaenia boesemani]
MHSLCKSLSFFPAMRLYQNTQVSQKMGLRKRNDRHYSWMIPPHQVIENQQQQEDDLIKPQKLINPVLASLQRRALHQELLFCYRRGVLPRRKPELQRVYEHKRREQHKKQERALHPPSDLEMKLCIRLQKMQLYELEEKRRRESLRNVPEFVHVRQTLKCIPNSS